MNVPSCYNATFNTSECTSNNETVCPEVCGICSRDYADRYRSPVVTIELSVDQPIHLFDVSKYERRLAKELGVSRAQLNTELSYGSTIVRTTIVTKPGTFQSAEEIEEVAERILFSAEEVSKLLDILVTKIIDIYIDLPRPMGPPAPPAAEDGLSTTMWIIIGSVVGVVLIAGGIALAWYFCRAKPSKDGPVSSSNTGYAPIVVYAQHPVYFNQDD
tara:strand:- start:438 stop:1085 length:648 start_codon:yes stop_codon:yes gene_type:complete